ncbi:MAG: YebC/PmpR family DNA-binding transcriptional regulator [Kiritimatiellales bacterium]|nr:YebC/PmpR family DNA-binding transcriptional regulator [Kiritimatiellota bacterium]MBL7011679.1 YebC/PmpR family DNA-binding transcriptional regulator [Kiritimatiellales bacterium]
MAGHSKWANIKHKKGRADAARGKVFSKIAKEIIVAASAGGGNLDDNIQLRALVQKAKGVSMPKDNIDRAIKKGTGELAGGALEEMVYEAYASGGVPVIVEALTDNKNRAASEIKNVLTKNGASLAAQGAISRLFQRKGQILISADATDEETLMDLVLEAGAEDMQREGDQFEVLTAFGDYAAVANAVSDAGIETESSELTMLPDMPTNIADKEQAQKLMRLVDLLEELDDVQNVYPGFEIDDSIVDELD